MKKKVIILPEAENDIDEIKDAIISISCSQRIAEDYADNLRAELISLSTYGSSLAFYTRRNITNRYGIFIRRANTKNKKIAILYYVESEYIIVKKIVWANSIE